MFRTALVVLSVLTFYTSKSSAQSMVLQPVHANAGAVVTFYLQTRLNPAAGNALDQLPKGTTVQVKLLDTIDSGVDRDGSEFHGSLAAPIISEDRRVILHPNAEVRGLFALLRSSSYPDGFRYELLVTRITENGKAYELTASSNPSFSDPSARNRPAENTGKPTSQIQKSN